MIGFIVAGLVIGALARLVLPGKQGIGIGLTLLLGVVGAVIGGTIANLVGSGDIFELNIFGFIVAVVAAVVLLAVAERAGLGQGRSTDAVGRGRH
ncbi:MAG: GlsB/YeaQ/YmgE family stress response membrane protein [Solirubrobacteraceae bacterium MAG38_C4-C5]|nr:GlsB/YeaQ/YmgE family stress response membrane protein [Candidatus Siliceabacter maunaloa]